MLRVFGNADDRHMIVFDLYPFVIFGEFYCHLNLPFGLWFQEWHGRDFAEINLPRTSTSISVSVICPLDWQISLSD